MDAAVSAVPWVTPALERVFGSFTTGVGTSHHGGGNDHVSQLDVDGE